MIKELIVGFGDQLRSKSKNPFFGTFIIVWTIRNWQFIITLFNLDLYPTLDEKFDVLKTYFADRNILLGLLTNTWITILAIIGTYTLLNIARAITNLFENKVTPWVYKHTLPGEIILRSSYDQLDKKLETLQRKYDEEKIKRVRAEEQAENIEKKLLQLNVQPADVAKIDFNKIHNILIENEDLDNFIDDAETIFKGDFLDKSVVGLYLQLGLIEKTGDYDTERSYFKLTEKGKMFWDFLLDQNEIGISKSKSKKKKKN